MKITHIISLTKLFISLVYAVNISKTAWQTTKFKLPLSKDWQSRFMGPQNTLRFFPHRNHFVKKLIMIHYLRLWSSFHLFDDVKKIKNKFIVWEILHINICYSYFELSFCNQGNTICSSYYKVLIIDIAHTVVSRVSIEFPKSRMHCNDMGDSVRLSIN